MRSLTAFLSSFLFAAIYGLRLVIVTTYHAMRFAGSQPPACHPPADPNPPFKMLQRATVIEPSRIITITVLQIHWMVGIIPTLDGLLASTTGTILLVRTL